VLDIRDYRRSDEPRLTRPHRRHPATACRRLSGPLLTFKALIWGVPVTALFAREAHSSSFASSVLGAVILFTATSHARP
jgi:hypothetical protein